jgi:ribonuclease P/MRP protein subunit POP3
MITVPPYRANGNRLRINPPSILRHIVYGINAVTKRLEFQSYNSRRPTIVIPTLVPSNTSFYIFVCRKDVEPAVLVDHLPHLVAS